MLHGDIIPEQSCQGELVEIEGSSTNLQFVKCLSCGTQFAIEPDSDWVTVMYPGMRN